MDAHVAVCHKQQCTLGFSISMICLFIGLQEVRPAHAMQRALSYTAHTSLVLIEGTLKVAAKTLWQNPKLIVLILVLYYYKEIWEAIKDGAGYLLGEYPVASFSAGALALWYINEVCKDKS